MQCVDVMGDDVYFLLSEFGQWEWCISMCVRWVGGGTVGGCVTLVCRVWLCVV